MDGELRLVGVGLGEAGSRGGDVHRLPRLAARGDLLGERVDLFGVHWFLPQLRANVMSRWPAKLNIGTMISTVRLTSSQCTPARSRCQAISMLRPRPAVLTA